MHPNLFKMSKLFSFILFLLCFQTLVAQTDQKSHTVLVSVAPYEYIVKRIVGDTQNILLLVPPGSSPHYFEPNAKQVLAAGKSDIWFLMGEGFERKALPPIKEYNPQIKIVDLRAGINLLYESCATCAGHGEPDPHIWMSPRDAKKQAKVIADTLISVYPEHKQLYEQNLVQLDKDFDTLDHQLSEMFSSYQGRTIMVSHPAYAYFCRDYGLIQLPIEFEGKDPSPKKLTTILENARSAKINTIFIQAQHSSKGAKLIANEIGAKIVTIDPLSENYLENIREIAKKFFNSFK
jgi:zinc transport system substrate-binding protein